MRIRFLALTGVAAVLALALGGEARAGDRPSQPAKRMASGIDQRNFDEAVRPQDDLFRYASGAWLKTAEIPAERSLYGAFVELADKAEADLRKIIEDAAAAESAEGSEARKVGDLYASFMDEDSVEKKGLEPIKDELNDVAAIEDKAEFIRELAHSAKVGFGQPVRVLHRHRREEVG